MKLGVIDSGIGGLTVLKTLIARCPEHEYIYYGDTLHMPYGEKSDAEVINYANQIISFLEERNVDVIIIACGTLSSNVDKLIANVPLIDLIKPLEGRLKEYQTIGIMATPLSIEKNYFQKYLTNDLYLIACPNLAFYIENDNLLLGCTHYPLIKSEIKKYFVKPIYELDTFLVDKIVNLKKGKFSLQIYFSKITDNLEKKVNDILALDKFYKIERSEINVGK